MHNFYYYLQSFIRLDYFYNFVHNVRLVHFHYWGSVVVVVGAVECYCEFNFTLLLPQSRYCKTAHQTFR